jgi:anti-sigma-K factor RskA
MSPDIHGLSGAYSVDALDEQERTAFERHLAQCPECQAEVNSLREAATHLSLLSAAQPPPALRASVLSAIKTVRPLPPLDAVGDAAGGAADVGSGEAADDVARDADAAVVVPLAARRRPRLAWLVAAAAAVLFAIGGLAWSPWDNGNDRGQLTATEQVLRAGDAQRFTKTVGGARATIVRSVSLAKAVIIADNMPAAPAGKDYQLWLDLPGRGMVSAGVMPHDAKPTITIPLEGDAAQATGAGITVEPAGGSSKPTTAPIVLYSFS